MTLTVDDYNMMCYYLAHLYETALYTHAGQTHPLVWYAAPDDRRADLDGLIGHVRTGYDGIDDFAFYNHAYLQTLKNSNPTIFNGGTVIWRRFQPERLRLDIGEGRYFDMLATCAALEQEMIDVLEAGVARFPMRSHYHREFPAPKTLHSGKGRSAVVGGATLMVVNDGGTYHALLSQRTAAHATNPGALHLIPAFVLESELMQPADDGRGGHYPLTDHLYRELLEELFGRDEASRAAVRDDPALQRLLALFECGEAGLYLLGIATNLMTLRLEICALLIVHDPDWWRSIQPDLQMPETQALLSLPLDSDEAMLTALPDDYFLNTVPQAIPTLWEGVALARQLIAARQMDNQSRS